MVNLVAIQMTSTPNIQENLDTVAHELTKLEKGQDTLVVLPECFARFGTRDKEQLEVAEEKDNGPIQTRLCELAKEHACSTSSKVHC